jgi:hypothetical protein
MYSLAPPSSLPNSPVAPAVFPAASSWASSTPGGGELAASVGCNTFSRYLVTSNLGGFTSGFIVLSGFVAPFSFTAANITIDHQAVVTLTHGYLGLYSCAANGDLTQIAVTADTPGMGINGPSKVPLLTPVALTAGSAYVAAMLFVGGLNSASGNSQLAVQRVGALTKQPFQMGYVTAGGATVLPASIPYSSITVYTKTFYAEITV